MSPTEALLLRLKKKSFYRNNVDEANHLHQLFFADPDSITLFKKFHDILIIDCTYKSNRYVNVLKVSTSYGANKTNRENRNGKPLLNICGVTGSNKTIQIALCFMACESTNSYVWALNQIAQFLSQEQMEMPKLIVTDRDRAFLNALNLLKIHVSQIY